MQKIVGYNNFISNYIIVHSDSLRKYATHLAYPSLEIVDDLFQETVYRCLKYSSLYTEQGSAEAWIKTIMRNIYFNEMNSAYHRNTCHEEIADKNEVDVDIEDTIAIDDLYHAIEMLNANEQIIITMRLQGYSYDEIATATHKKVGTIKSTIHRIKARLRCLLNR